MNGFYFNISYFSSDSNYLPKSCSKEILCDIEPLSSPQSQLQVIIRQLEMQNRELQQILLLGSHNDKDIRRYLEEHRIHVAAQIQKLKILKVSKIQMLLNLF